MMSINIEEIELSFDETYHIYRGKPLYNKRFKKVMSFHPPGIAAVEDETGAYHIDLRGEPIYDKRYLKTYGFYEGIATVVDEDGYFHIDVHGNPTHKRRFAWTGNFQEGRCVVRDFKGNYFHITKSGEDAYKKKYAYAGDYKYGIAVVYDFDGYATHIERNGKMIHGKKYLELGVYHKGYAIARDDVGYFHIDKSGNELYKYRFAWIENFYNDYALARMFDGRIVVVNTKGEIIHDVTDRDALPVVEINRRKIMAKLVGYWHTQIIYSIVKTGVLEYLAEKKLSKDELQKKTGLPLISLDMILNYLLINNMVEFVDDGTKFKITQIGLLLTEKSKRKLKYAALMWGEGHYITMSHLIEALYKGDEVFKDLYGDSFFEYLEKHPEKNEIYQNAMREYSVEYDQIIQNLKIPEYVKVVADVGGGYGSLLKKILFKNPHISRAILFDLPSVVNSLKDTLDDDKIVLMGGNFFEDFPFKADAIIMSRILHDWNDEYAIKILTNVKNALNKNGIVYIIEMIIPAEVEYDCGHSLNFNLLVMVGGRERKLSEFKKLFDATGFYIEDVLLSERCRPSVIVLKLRGD